MPGRSFTPPTAYRYGFNGKEKDDEVNNIEGGDIDFGARIYDARLGRWMSKDPKMKKYTAISPYSYVNNCPIFWQDKEGKELWLGENREISIADIKSLVPPRFQSAIVVSSEGKVTLDLSLTTEDAWDGNDAGLKLLQNLIDAPQKYLYEANDMITVTYNKLYPQGEVDANHKYNVKDEEFQRDGGNNVVNFSLTNRDNPSSNRKDEYTPKPGYDGQVAVGVSWGFEEAVEDGFTGRVTKTPKQRNTVVFHELSENYYRTTEKLPYEYYQYDEFGRVKTTGIMEKIVDATKNGAHQMAVIDESNFWQKSTNPGIGSPDRSQSVTPEICPAHRDGNDGPKDPDAK